MQNINQKKAKTKKRIRITWSIVRRLKINWKKNEKGNENIQEKLMINILNVMKKILKLDKKEKKNQKE